MMLNWSVVASTSDIANEDAAADNDEVQLPD